MSEKDTFLICLLLIMQGTTPTALQALPQQIHLSLGNQPTDMVVTWVTFTRTNYPFVWYGILSHGLTHKAVGRFTKFVDGGLYHSIRYIHRVTVRSLKPDTFYVYRCGSLNGISQPFVFKTIPEGTDWSPRLIVYGDMGLKGAKVLPYVTQEIRDYNISAIMHIGDIAYNMDMLEGVVGDFFMRMIQQVATTIPYMTTVGNHEQAYNFSHYKNRFTMPGNSEGLFYSFDMGPAHFVAISTEVYYFYKYGYQQLINQFEWLQEDLRNAAMSRANRPWIVVFGHRPLYCSSDTGEDCAFLANILKCCNINNTNYGLEELFHQYQVDLYIAGHMHYYERSFPIFDNEVFNGSGENPYKNAKATVHIISGAAGMKSGTENPCYIRTEFFPFFNSENSYTIMTVHNKTHLRLEQVSANRGGQVIDSFYLVKNPIVNPKP